MEDACRARPHGTKCRGLKKERSGVTGHGKRTPTRADNHVNNKVDKRLDMHRTRVVGPDSPL